MPSPPDKTAPGQHLPDFLRSGLSAMCRADTPWASSKAGYGLLIQHRRGEHDDQKNSARGRHRRPCTTVSSRVGGAAERWQTKPG